MSYYCCYCSTSSVTRAIAVLQVCKYSAGMGNTPSVSCSRTTPAKERPPRSVNDMDLWFSGSAHGVPIELPCLRWQSKATREPNSPRHSRHLNPNYSGTCALPCPRVSLGQHLDACYGWRSTASCTNFLPEIRTHNIPLDPKLKLNTTQKEYA